MRYPLPPAARAWLAVLTCCAVAPTGAHAAPPGAPAASKRNAAITTPRAPLTSKRAGATAEAPATPPAPKRQAAPEGARDLAGRLEVARSELQAEHFGGVLAALRDAPVSVEVTLLRAKALLWSGTPERAERVILDAPSEIREHVDIALCWTKALLAQGRFLEAKAAAQAALMQSHDHPDALALRREALRGAFAVGASASLADALDWRASETDPAKRAEGEKAVAGLLKSLPKPKREGGIAEVEQRWPKEPARELLLLEQEREWGLFTGAFERAAALAQDGATRERADPIVAGLACAAAWEQLGKKNPERARAVAARVEPARRPTCLVHALAEAEMASGRHADGLNLYAALAIKEPSNKDFALGFARATLVSNRIDRARDALRAARRAGAPPTDLDALTLELHVRSASAALERFDTAGAEREARAALALRPTSVDGTLLLSTALQIAKRPEDAVKEVRAALRRSPRDARLLAALARLPGDHDHVDLARRARASADGLDEGARSDLDLALGDALLRAKRFDEAEVAFRDVATRHPGRPEPRLRLAQVSMHRGDYFEARARVEAAQALGSTFDTTLSLADVHHALNLETEALRLGRLALTLRPGQPDAAGFVDRLQFAHAPAVGLRALYYWDNGTNLGLEFGGRAETDLNPDLRISADLAERRLETQASDQRATLDTARFGLRQQVGARLALSLTGGVSSLRAPERAAAILPAAEARADLRVGAAHRLSFAYQADAFSYTAGMVAAHVGTHALAMTANGPLAAPLWFYASGSATQLTDGNRRGIAFASLYSSLVASPVVKVGVNGQILSYAESSPRSYFSPSRLVNAEAFAEVLRDEPEARVVYGLLAAGGVQRIEGLAAQPTYRFSALAGFRPFRQLKVSLRGQKTTSATSNVAGFQYTEVGLALDGTIY
jgi:Tfp pilus assembly protein PilF